MNRPPVALFTSPAKAERIKQRLSSSGFAAELHGERWLQAFWFVSKPKAGVCLEVPADQFERAEQFLLDCDAREHALHDAICEDCHFMWPWEGMRSSRIRPHQAPYYFIEGIEQKH